MKMRDLKEMNDTSLNARKIELEGNLLEMRFDVRSGKEKNHAQLGFIKRDLARVKTALSDLQKAEK